MHYFSGCGQYRASKLSRSKTCHELLAGEAAAFRPNLYSLNLDRYFYIGGVLRDESDLSGLAEPVDSIVSHHAALLCERRMYVCEIWSFDLPFPPQQ